MGRTIVAVAYLAPVILVMACSSSSSTGAGSPDAQSPKPAPSDASGSDSAEVASGTDAGQSTEDASGSECVMAGGQCLSGTASCGRLGSETCPPTQAGSFCCLPQ